MSQPHTRKSRQQDGLPQRNLMIGAAVAIVVVIIGAALLIAGSGPAEVNLDSLADESVSYPSVGNEHIEVGSPHNPYNSNPPTSGPHYATWANVGNYNQELPDEYVVHNLEHGHVWLSYRDATDNEVIDLFTRLQEGNPNWIIVTHRPGNPTRLAAATWQHLLALDELDENALRAFIERYRDKAPESIAG